MMALGRNFVTVGGATALSRVLGFVRDIFIATLLGTGVAADAFFAAFRLPNLFRRLFAEGAFNAAFVPLFSETLQQKGEVAARILSAKIISLLMIFLALVILLAQIFMDKFVWLLVPGFADEADKFALTVLLSRICFGYLFFVSLMAAYAGILNSLRKFLAAAIAPVLLNIVLVGLMALTLVRGDISQIGGATLLAWGVLAGGVAQCALLVFAVHRAGFLPKIRRPGFGPDIKKILTLMGPAVLSSGIVQINIFIGTIIASQQNSAISYLYFADRLYQLPLGIIGIGIGVVLLPELSRLIGAGEVAKSIKVQDQSLIFALYFTFPAMMAFWVVGSELISVLFEHGSFNAEAVRQTASALSAFAVGLPAFVLIKVLQPGFFARHDTKTPSIYAGLSVVINVGLSWALFPVLGHVGIAIATSVAAWLNVGFLFVTQHRRDYWHLTFDLVQHIGRILLLCILMGVVLWGLALLLGGALSSTSALWMRIGALVMLVSMGGGLYIVAGHIGGVMNLSTLVKRGQ